MERIREYTVEELQAVFVTEAIQCETGILRNKKSKDNLHVNSSEICTMLDLLEVNIKNKKDIFIGFTKHTSEGSCIERKFTYSSLRVAAKAYSFNLKAKNLYTDIELDNKHWKLMGIYSKNTPSWLLTYLGHMYNDITTVSIYDTFGVEGLEHILNLTQMQTIVVQSLFLKRISEMNQQGKIKYLKNLIVCDLDLDQINYENEYSEYLKKNEFNLFNLKDFINEGEEIMNNSIQEDYITRCRPESIALICFTSGSTGIPKGALLSQQGLANQGISVLHTHNLNVNNGDTHLSYLPYAHVFEQIFLSLILYLGVNIVYYNGDAMKLSQDIRVTRPDFLLAVPRVLLRFYDVIMMKLKSLTGFKKLVLELAFKEKMKIIQNERKFDYFIYDKLFFNEIKEMIFGRKKINFVLTGSAPIEGKILDFFKMVFGCPVLEGYGMTELGGALTYTDPNDYISGHVGYPLSISEIKLVDVPELNYYTTDLDPHTGKSMPRGEIWARSRSSFEGYLCQKEETDNILDINGWVHTGDIGQLIEGNRLKIIDRRKNIFKLSQAEYIAPEKIENVLKLCPHITQSWIYGKSTANYIVSLIVLDPDYACKMANNLKIQFDHHSELLSNESMKQYLMKEVENTCRIAKLATYEIPKKILLTYNQFTIDNGMLTVTMKAMRTNIRKEWECQVASLYDS